MKPRIVFLDESTLGKVDNLSLISDLGDYAAYDHTVPEDRISRIGNAEIVITNKVIIDQEVMDGCPGLRLICISATGMNNVDLDYAREKGISVKNVAGYSTESVAQATFSMLFHLLHRNDYYQDYVFSGKYAESKIFTHYGPEFFEIHGRQWGIIGMGNIGRRVAEIAKAFGASVVYYSTSGNNKDAGYPHLGLEELLAGSDIVSVHCPLNEQTEGLIGEKELQLMPGHAILLNMGRGGIVDEQAWARAIDNNKSGGAATDVLTREPINADHPLLQVKNKERLFITPHNAWASIESRRKLVEQLADNISEYLKQHVH